MCLLQDRPAETHPAVRRLTSCLSARQVHVTLAAANAQTALLAEGAARLTGAEIGAEAAESLLADTGYMDSGNPQIDSNRARIGLREGISETGGLWG